MRILLSLIFGISCVLLSLFSSCSQRSKEKDISNQEYLNWRYLTLEINDSVLQIDAFSDTVKLMMYKKEVLNFIAIRELRDSMYLFSDALMEFKGQPKHTCTDYVSRLNVRLRMNDQVYKEVKFSSLCNWREIDTSAVRLSSLITRILSPKK